MIVICLGLLAAVFVAFAVNAASPGKLSATGTERAIHRYTTYTSITCQREAGSSWKGWDYRCEGRAGRECDVFDVEVDANDVTNQDGPGACTHRP